MISKYRKSASRFVGIVSAPFIFLHVPPLAVTLLSLPFAFLFAVSVCLENFGLAFAFGILALLMDAVDGTVARKTSSATLCGNYFDAIVDKAVDFVLIGSFVIFFPIETVCALGASFLVSYAKPRVALVVAIDNHDWPGIGERGDKMLLLLFGVLLATFFGVRVIRFVLWLFVVVALVGFFQRLSYARKLIREKEVFLDRE